MKIDFDQNEVRIEIEGLEYNLHPLWIRERSNEENMVDQNSLQRLYDPEKLPVDLKISDLTHINKEKVRIKFSDDHAAEYCLKSLAKELQRSKGLPEKILWDNSNIELKNFEFNYDENEDDQLLKILHYYHQYGFVLVSGLDPKDGEVINFANKIGYIRETNFGKLFNVVSQKQPNDLAYTSIELESHTDNPYRKPVPSIQFLFCIENSCEGGDSTVVDGFKVATDLKDKKPEVFETLSKTLINFKSKDKVSVKGGALGIRTLSAEDISQLATLPGLDQLRGQLLALLNTPASSLVTVLSAPARGMVTVLKAKADKE